MEPLRVLSTEPPDGRPVPSAILEPNWQPGAWRKRAKRTRRIEQSQDEQIRANANRIRERDQAILLGSYVPLEEAAARWQQVLSAHAKNT
jgi:hypothetical protein